MRYFPIADPISDLRLVALDRSRCELTLFIDGNARGIIRLFYRELAGVLDLFKGDRPVAVIDLWEETAQWLVDDYKKTHVIGDDGSLYHIGDLA
jgi:hypothetical protein